EVVHHQDLVPLAEELGQVAADEAARARDEDALPLELHGVATLRSLRARSAISERGTGRPSGSAQPRMRTLPPPAAISRPEASAASTLPGGACDGRTSPATLVIASLRPPSVKSGYWKGGKTSARSQRWRTVASVDQSTSRREKSNSPFLW